MITLLDNLECNLEKYDIPPEVWTEWKSSIPTQCLYEKLREKQIEMLDDLIQKDVCVRTIRGCINTLEEILNYQPENIDV